MAFRDETEALRARVRALERELEEAKTTIAELQARVADRDALAARLAAVDARRPLPPRPVPAPDAARRTRSARIAGLVIAATIGAISLFIFVAEEGGSWLPAMDIDADGAPTAGMVELASHPSPPPLSVTVTGVEAADAVDGSCRGYVPERPLLVLRAAGPVALDLSTASAADTVLLLRTADGTIHCDDDSGGGGNARIVTAVGAGDHRVWVGTYHENVQAAVELRVVTEHATAGTDETGLGSRAAPTLGVLALRGDLERVALAGEARGLVPAERVASGCRGALPIAPQLLVRLAEPSFVHLTTESSLDLVMLVRQADGSIVCDDDGGAGVNPLVNRVLPAGEHRVWVGPFDRTLQGPFELRAFARRGTDLDDRGLAAAAPPSVADVRVDEGPERTFEGTAGGIVDTRGMGCQAFLPHEPHLVLRLAAARDVTLQPVAGQPVELFVEHPDRSHSCHRGELRATWGPGARRVWVGTTEVEQLAPFTLTMRAEPASITPFRTR